MVLAAAIPAPGRPTFGAVANTRRAILVPVLTGLVIASAACGDQEFEDRTARVSLGDRTITFDVDSCGLDGDTAFVVGSTQGGAVVQAVIGVADDDGTGVPEATGLTIFDDGVTTGAFGPESWSRRGEAGTPPGEITEAGVTGSRIRASGTVIPLTDEGTLRTTDGTAEDQVGQVEFSFDARCDLVDD